MAVLEVAKIQVRSGLYEDLPALDTGEFGWCVDTQQLFIGKGTLAEGAPETGVTEILTEYTTASIINSFNSLNANVANIAAIAAAITSQIGNLIPVSITLSNNQSTLANVTAVAIEAYGARDLNYRIVMNAHVRSGTISVVQTQGNLITFSDDYVESGDTGVELYFTGNASTQTAVLGYTSTAATNGNLTYYLQSFT
jgi:hypothetical protein